MDTEYTRGALDPETRSAGPLRFVLSAPGRKRDGLELDNRRFRLENFQRNPVMLWMHGADHARGDLPVGRWRDVRVTRDGQLVGNAEFDMEDPFAAEVERKYRNGFLNAVSIGWAFGEDRDGLYQDLWEASAVAVPADPDALIAGRSIVLTSREYESLTARVAALEASAKRTAILDALKAR